MMISSAWHWQCRQSSSGKADPYDRFRTAVVHQVCRKGREWVTERRFMSVAPCCLQFDLLGNRQRVIDLYPEVADGALKLRVTE